MKTYSKEEQEFLEKHKKISIGKNFTCPFCNRIHSEEISVKERTKPLFTGDIKDFDYEPGYTFLEINKCEKTDIEFIIRNGY
jgi:hypothetical protein